MARSIQLSIHESQQELEQHLSNQKSATGKERLQMLTLAQTRYRQESLLSWRSYYTTMKRQSVDGF
jgi:hypothetical protein